MASAFAKELTRSVRGSVGRFLAIAGIVALGCGFFAGLSMAGLDMRLAADALYDGTGLYDVRVVSTMGLTQEQLDIIASVDGVEAIMPGHAVDATVSLEDMQFTARIASIPVDSARASVASDSEQSVATDDPSYLNRLVLAEGRWPEAANECLASADRSSGKVAAVGDTIRVLYGASSLDDVLEVRELTVVGLVHSSSYVSNATMGYTSLGSGLIDQFLYVPWAAFAEDLPYTEVFLTVEGAADELAGSDAYWDVVDRVTDALDGKADRIAASRLAEVRLDAQEQVDDATREYEDERAKVEQELDDARQQLDEALATLEESAAQLADGESQLARGQEDLAEGRRQAAAELAKAKDAGTQIAAAERELDAQEAQARSAKQQIEDGQAAWAKQRSELESQHEQLAAQKAGLEAERERVANQIQELETAVAQLKELQAAEAQLEQGIAQAEAGIAQLEQGIAALEAQIAATDDHATKAALEQQLAALQQQLAQAQGALSGLRTQLAQVQAGIQQLEQAGVSEQALEQARAGLAQLDAGIAQLADGIAQIDAGIQQGDAAVAEAAAKLPAIEEGLAQIAAGREQLAARKAQLEAGWSAYQANKAQVEAQLASAQAQLDGSQATLEEGRRQLEQGWAEYRDGLAEYEDGRATADREFADAAEQLAEAQADVDALEAPDVYVLDRATNLGVASYQSDSERIDNIARVFPLIFFLVAALVALTTMTRMVDEERIEIGTHKALGFSTAKITSKYLLYAATAGIAGAFVGIALLSQVLPVVVMVAYAIMYSVPIPPLPLPISLPISSLAVLGGVGVTLLATWGAAAATLREVPAALMLPRAPKAGKRILLERIGPLWARLSFTWKVTFRNLFRYKRRLLMTIVGIAGCTALLLTGLGLHDSIWDIIDNQFEGSDPIIRYNVIVGLDDDFSTQDEDDVRAILGRAGSSTEFWSDNENMQVASEDSPDPMALLVVVPENPDEFTDAVVLRDRLSREPVEFTEDSVVLTEKAATMLGVGVGDTIRLYDQDDIGNAVGTGYEFQVTGVCENYVRHYCYVGEAEWERVTGDTPSPESVFALVDATDEEARTELSAELHEVDGVSTVAFNSDAIETYRKSLSSVNMVVVVLVIAAAALAFIVLYNLTNINIIERTREIASLKVLGFDRREVAAYVFREVIMLVVMGSLVGLVLGVFLEQFVVIAAEVDIVMFGRTIHWPSFVWAIVATLGFSGLVMLAMLPKLRNISMVESLKSVD